MSSRHTKQYKNSVSEMQTLNIYNLIYSHPYNSSFTVLFLLMEGIETHINMWTNEQLKVCSENQGVYRIQYNYTTKSDLSGDIKSTQLYEARVSLLIF